MPLTESPLDLALRELTLLVRSRYGLLVLDAPHEDRTRALLKSLAQELGLPQLHWTPARGLAADRAPAGRTAAEPGALHGTQSFAGALDFLLSSERPTLSVFEHAEGFLDDPVVVARLLELARKFARNEGALILQGQVELPPSLLAHAAALRVLPPSADEYRELVRRVFRELSRGVMSLQFDMTDDHLQQLVGHLRGFSLLEAEKILARVMLEDGKLSLADLARVSAAKRAVVEREGLLEYVPVTHDLRGVAGFARLKAWLAQRSRLLQRAAEARSFGLSFPRGILLLGVPGVGKSHVAKAVAAEWGLPLLKLDAGALYDKFVGETERNFRRATRSAERLAPIVLWIDEIEKAFATGGEADGGASRRTLGQFLSWLQDRAGDVFIVATANDVRSLPPELLRKGRFDELFFLDLPDAAARQEVLRIHLQRRGHDPQRLDLNALALACDGFSGAEIEAAVVAALHAAFAADGPLEGELLLRELRSARPLSVTRAEELHALRRWARERTVSAD